MRRFSRNCNGTLQITASELLAVDRAAVGCRREHGSSDGSTDCGASCHPLKLKADSQRLPGVNAILSIVSSTVGSGSRICWCDILQ